MAYSSGNTSRSLADLDQRGHEPADPAGSRGAALPGMDGEISDSTTPRRFFTGKCALRLGRAGILQPRPQSPQGRQAIAKDGWPSTFDALLALPGLGPYTAAAIGSLSFGLQVPMVDGNVMRVLSRFHALALDPRSGIGVRRLRDLATDWIRCADAGEMNEATMELGALVCKPRNPSCGVCPLAATCRACAMGTPEAFPPARARKEIVAIRRKVVVVEQDGCVLLRKAEGSELLAGLWILPAEGETPALVADGHGFGSVRHSITHHQVVWEVVRGVWAGGAPPSGWQWHCRVDLPAVVVSSLLRKALEMASILPALEHKSREIR